MAPKLTPVDFDPFAEQTPKLTPVDFDPFAEQPKRSLLGDMKAGLKGGLYADAPEMVGQAVKALSPVGSDPYKWGQEQVEASALMRQHVPEITPGQRTGLGDVLVKGAQGVGQMAPMLALAAASGPAAPLVMGGTSAGLYGSSTYQDTKERMLAQEGLDDVYAAANPGDPRVRKAKLTAGGSGVVQGLGEAAAGYVGGKFIKALPVGDLFGGAAKTGVDAAKQFGKRWAGTVATEAMTEAAQDEGQAAVERAAGLKDAPGFMEQALDSAKGGAGMALLLGPLGAHGSYRQYQRDKAASALPSREEFQAEFGRQLDGLSDAEVDTAYARYVGSSPAGRVADVDLLQIEHKPVIQSGWDRGGRSAFSDTEDETRANGRGPLGRALEGEVIQPIQLTDADMLAPDPVTVDGQYAQVSGKALPAPRLQLPAPPALTNLTTGDPILMPPSPTVGMGATMGAAGPLLTGDMKTGPAPSSSGLEFRPGQQSMAPAKTGAATVATQAIDPITSIRQQIDELQQGDTVVTPEYISRLKQLNSALSEAIKTEKLTAMVAPGTPIGMKARVSSKPAEAPALLGADGKPVSGKTTAGTEPKSAQVGVQSAAEKKVSASRQGSTAEVAAPSTPAPVQQGMQRFKLRTKGGDVVHIAAVSQEDAKSKLKLAEAMDNIPYLKREIKAGEAGKRDAKYLAQARKELDAARATVTNLRQAGVTVPDDWQGTDGAYEQDMAESGGKSESRYGWNSLSVGEKADTGKVDRETFKRQMAETKAWGVFNSAALREAARNKAGINIWRNEAEMRQAVGDAAVSVSSENDGRVEGMYDPKTGQVHVFAESISDPVRAQYVLRHEMRHRGLRSIFGSQLNVQLEAVWRGNKKAILAYTDSLNVLRVGAGLKGLNPTESHADLLEATDEWLAQTDKTGGPIARLIAAARNLLRNMGLDLQWSDADILALAGKSLREGGKVAKGDDANRLSMGGVDNNTRKMDNVNTQGDYEAGGNVEVAPNPDDRELSDRWDKVAADRQRVISRQIMDEFGPAVFNHHGLGERDYRITHVEGGFLGKTNPSSVVKFFTGTWEQRRAALVDLGHVLKQQSVVLFDANDQANGPQGYFVAVTPEAQLTPDEVDDLYRAIHKQMPEAEGFSQVGNTLVIGNFTEYNDKLPTMGNDEFYARLEEVVDGLGTFELDSSSYRSEYIEMAAAIKEEQDADNQGDAQQRLVQEKSRQWRDDLQKAATARLDGLLPRYSIGGAAGVERAGRTGGQGADERYSLPVGQDGRVRLVHYSYREGLSVLDPAKHGTGINGAESKRKRDYPEYWVDRTYFGVEGGSNDYRKEPGLGPHEYRAGIALDRLYNFSADPDGLLAQSVDSWGQRNISLYEKRIKEAGYEGYYTGNTQLGDVVAKFSPTAIGEGLDGADAQGAAGAGVGATAAAAATGDPLSAQRTAAGMGEDGQTSVPAAPGVRFSIAPPATSPEFKAWTAGLPLVNPKRVPSVRRNGDQATQLAHLGPGVYPMVHITNHDFTVFDPKIGDDSADSRGNHPFFFTPSPQWAAEFKEVDTIPAEVEAWIEANGRPTDDAGWLRMQDATGYGWHPTNVMPVYAKTERPFRYWDQSDIDTLEQALRDNGEWVRLPKDMREAISKGDWMVIEQREVQDAIRSAGFDAFFLNETNTIKSLVKDTTKFQVNLAVFKPENIKALRGNVGSYGQRPVTEAEAALLNMSAAEANEAQAQGDIRFSVTPRSGNDLPLDIATVATHSPALIEKHARAIGASYTGFKFRPFEKPLDTINRLKKHMADNLVWLYNATPGRSREMSAKWYEGANRIAQGMATQYGYTTEQAAGAIAALSPQQPWFNNLYLADRVMRYMSQADNLQWRVGMADRLPSKLSHLSGRGLADLHASDERAAWIRAYDEAVGPGQVAEYLPDGTAVGTAGTGMWFVGNDMIAKAVNILDGAPVRDNLSLAHKVRNFYNNIVDPQDLVSVTIDTHAVAAAFLAPMGGTSREVLHNFGGAADGGKPGSSAGAIGTYYIVADAYRDAAARLGVLPRELQSVVWEQVRTMFPAAWKRSAAARTISQKWSDYAKGKKEATLEAVRGYIAETVGLQPSAGGNAQTGGAADQGQLYRNELGARRDGGRPGSGVAGGDTRGAGVVYSVAPTIDIDGVSRPTTNSNGQPIHATEEGIRNFWRWFGDSKVVDSEGRPLVVYHGTTADIKQFDKLALGISTDAPSAKKAFFFSDSHKVAAGYAALAPTRASIESDMLGRVADTNMFSPETESFIRDQASKKLNDEALQDSRFFSESGFTGKANVMPVYVRMSNPLIVDYKGDDARETSFTSALKEAQQQGQDGVIFKNAEDSMHKDYAEISNIFALIQPTQIKSATGNAGAFDGSNADIRYSLAADRFGYLTAAQRAMLERVGGIVEPATVRDRVSKLKGSLMDGFVQKVADQFAPLKDLDPTAYLQARMTRGSTGALEALLMYGNLHIEDGVYDTKAGETSGLIKTMQRLQGEQDRFLWWMASNRAAELKAEDREQLFSDEDIATGKTLHQGSMPDGTSRETLYRSVLAEYRRINSNVLDIAMESGIIDSTSRELWDKAFYVPFYRAMEDGSATPNIAESRGLIGQYASKRLKGGKQKINEDLMANVLMNWGHLLSASAKNRAAKTALSAAERAGVARRARAGAAGAVWYMGRYAKTIPRGQEYVEDGVTKVSDGTHQMEAFGKIHYTVDDPYIMQAISAIEYAGPSGPGAKLLGEFKRMLTYGVTLSPTFKLRNLIRDSIASIAVSPLGANPLSNVRTGVALMRDKESQTYASALASGALIRFGTMLEGSSSAHLQRLINQGVDENTIVTKWEHIKDKATAAKDWYENIGDISEGANRIALYQQQLEAGKSHAEAAFAARDLLDFSMGGTSAAVRYLTTVVPFMNARIQGLYKLGRGAKENPARFASVIGATAMASIALMLAYKDDDDWKRREEWDRDNFWWFKLDGVAYRIPKPFEVGAIATLAERGLELMVDDEMNGKRFADAMQRMVGGTLAFNPVPQAFKPILDVYANKDSFTGRDIETMGMDRYLKSERIGSKTSEVARFLGAAGNVTNVSPVQVDHMIKAYFGWLGTAVTTAVDYGVRPMLSRPERPSMSLKDVFFVGNFASTLPAGSSRYLTQLYDQAKEVEQAYATYAKMVKAGDAGATEFFEANREKIAAKPLVSQATRTLSTINQRIRAVEATPYMTPREKRIAINRLEEARNQLAGSVAPRLG